MRDPAFGCTLSSMLTTSYRRLAAVFAATWLALVLAELPALHVCSVHSLAPVQAVAANASAASENHATHPPQNQSHEHGKQCSCLGSVTHPPAVAIQKPATLFFGELILERSPVLPAGDETLPPPPEFSLPFSNGPPALAVLTTSTRTVV